MNSTSLKINKTINYYNKKFEENTSKWYKLNIYKQWLKLKEEIKKQSINIEIRESNKTKDKIQKLTDKLETAKDSRAIFLKEEINNILKEQANQINIHINNKETPTKYLTRRLKIDQKILDQINQPIEEYEIRLGIEKIQEGKAPGKDGLLPTFYKNHIN
ncbi:hypothetical protein ACTFIY_003892 [Dictyostelium cf. discoideum]